ncbi:MAG: hypothetical protein RLY93_09660 [Sumerlaeia bacterium]
MNWRDEINYQAADQKRFDDEWHSEPEISGLKQCEVREGLRSLVEDGDLRHRVGSDGRDEYTITQQGLEGPVIIFGEWTP